MLTMQGTYKKGAIRIRKRLKEGTEVTVLVPERTGKKLTREEYLMKLDELEGSWAGNKKIESAFKEAREVWKKWKIQELS